MVEVRNERVTGHGMQGRPLGPRGSEFRVILYRLRLIGVGVAKESCPGHRCSLTYTGAFAKSRRSPVWLGQDAQSLAVAVYAPSLSLGFRVCTGIARWCQGTRAARLRRYVARPSHPRYSLLGFRVSQGSPAPCPSAYDAQRVWRAHRMPCKAWLHHLTETVSSQCMPSCARGVRVAQPLGIGSLALS